MRFQNNLIKFALLPLALILLVAAMFPNYIETLLETRQIPVSDQDQVDIQTKTYINSKFGYSLEYPSGWLVETERAIVDGYNKILSLVNIRTTDESRRISIVVNEREWLLKYETPITEKVIVAGSQQTAYLFPNGYECGMDGGDTKDCSFFVVPIYHNDLWYEIWAVGNAKTVTEKYRKILSAFTFSN